MGTEIACGIHIDFNKIHILKHLNVPPTWINFETWNLHWDSFNVIKISLLLRVDSACSLPLSNISSAEFDVNEQNPSFESLFWLLFANCLVPCATVVVLPQSKAMCVITQDADSGVSSCLISTFEWKAVASSARSTNSNKQQHSTIEQMLLACEHKYHVSVIFFFLSFRHRTQFSIYPCGVLGSVVLADWLAGCLVCILAVSLSTEYTRFTLISNESSEFTST